MSLYTTKRGGAVWLAALDGTAPGGEGVAYRAALYAVGDAFEVIVWRPGSGGEVARETFEGLNEAGPWARGRLRALGCTHVARVRAPRAA